MNFDLVGGNVDRAAFPDDYDPEVHPPVDSEQHCAEKGTPVLARCPGTSTSARNVTRAWVGDMLPMVGDCQTCGGQVEITRKWTVKYHRTRNK